MHRDQKIGLSLAVLIVGFAGAFCFRNEPLSDPGPLALEQVVDLDARIEHLPVRAYVQREGVGKLNTDVLRSTSDLVDAADVESPVLTMGYDDVAAGDVLDLYAGPPEPLVPPEQAPEGSAAPEPAVAALAVVNAPPAVAKVVGTPSPEPTAAIALESSVEPGFNEPVGRTYIAKTGDTLSGVSLQMYGTCSKYLEIYRANREVLRDPDDLPVGTKLTIPPVEAAKAVAPH